MTLSGAVQEMSVPRIGRREQAATTRTAACHVFNAAFAECQCARGADHARAANEPVSRCERIARLTCTPRGQVSRPQRTGHELRMIHDHRCPCACLRRDVGQDRQGIGRGAGYGRVVVGNNEVVQLLPPIVKETTFPPDVLLECMTWAGVDRAVLLQGPFYGERNAEVADAIRRWPDRFTGAGLVDPWSAGANETFEEAAGHHGLRVFKLEMSPEFGLSGLHDDVKLDDRHVSWFWTSLERLQMTLVLDLGPIGSSSYQTSGVTKLIDAHPDLKIVIAHLGQPTAEAERDPALWALWDAQIKLGLHPQVWFDTSALPHRAQPEQYPFPSIGRWVRRAVDLIGPQSLIWGSDAPALLTVANYNGLLSVMQHHFDFLGPADRELVFGRSALEAYPFSVRDA